MTPRIEYFFSCVSPFVYLGHDLFTDIAARYGAEVTYKPTNFMQVFPETGGLPLPKRAPARIAYRTVELKRWREKRELPLNLQPAHFPADPTLADCSVIALAEAGSDPAPFIARACRAVWAYDRDIADRHVVEGLLADCGHDAHAILAAATSEPVRATNEGNVREAIDRSIFGAPTYVLNGELFWGQDRLDLLEDALKSGRAPILS